MTNDVYVRNAEHLETGFQCLRKMNPRYDIPGELRKMNGSGTYVRHCIERLGEVAILLKSEGAKATHAAGRFINRATADLTNMLDGYRSHEAYKLLVDPMARVGSDEARRHYELLCALYPGQEEALRTPYLLALVRNAALALRSSEVPQ